MYYILKWASLVVQTVKDLPAMWETCVLFLGLEIPLEKGMATHCCVVAWIIPWTEEPGGLQFTGSQRIGHNLATNTHIFLNTLGNHVEGCFFFESSK